MTQRRNHPPVEWGKFGRVRAVARFLHLPEDKVRALQNLGLLPARNGYLTPEDLRDAWKAHAWQLEAAQKTGAIGQHPFQLLSHTAPRVAPAPRRDQGQPLEYRPPRARADAPHSS